MIDMATNDEILQQMRELAEIVSENTIKAERLWEQTQQLYQRMQEMNPDTPWFDTLVRRVAERIMRLSASN
jgi:hypothetical protein